MDKKAFEIQFNWIFVLVAGAAILLFFAVIIVKQKNVSETSTKSTVLKSIEAIITGAGVTTDSWKTEQIPGSSIEVQCNRLSVGGVSKQYENLILFAPNPVSGGKILWQTMAFNTPYRATNFLFMTSLQARYIIIGDSNLANEINKSLSSDLKKEFYRLLPEIKNGGNYKVRFVFFDDAGLNGVDLSKLEGMPDSDVTAIKISGDMEKGAIDFYQKNQNSWAANGHRSFYIGKASLIGAVYADSAELYECNMKSALSRLALVTRIYKDKTDKLAGTQQQCEQFYTNAKSQLGSIDTSASRLAVSSNFDMQNVNAIVSAANAVSKYNKEMQKFSCPTIY